MRWRFARPYLLLVLALGDSSLADSYPPPAGTDRESTAYLDAVEKFLTELDLNDSSLSFQRLGGTTATNWSVIKDGRTLADLKCTSGNTNHHGAIIAYRLGRELDFNIYPVAVYREVHRNINGKRLDEQCALKEWSSVFTQYYWTHETFVDTNSHDKQSLIRALDCDHPIPDADDRFWYKANSAYGNPGVAGANRVPYRGETSLIAAAADFSNMMLIDTLIGNEDRFPGGNLFFRSVSTTYERVDGAIVFHDVRLFSLDNEAAFKSQHPGSTHSATDLREQVSRFDASMLGKLQELSGNSDQLSKITDGNQRLIDFLSDGIQIVSNLFDESIDECGTEGATF